jgi:cell fate regulator YaaT (PSP1 superfamily)
MPLIRVGTLAQVGRFRPVDNARYGRGERVVVRTSRGLELGEVLTEEDDAVHVNGDGEVIRRMTVEDDLLAARLEKNRQAAYVACVDLLRTRQIDSVLLDVEQLFDGRSLYFHFLGDVPPALEPLLAELAEAYEAEAKLGQFADVLTNGCGPGCGTEEAKGQGGCATCTGCAVASACSR